MLLPESAERWIQEATGAGVAETWPLVGGSHARTALVRLRGSEKELILRRFPPGDDSALRETKVLIALGGAPWPCLIASDPHGERCGSPAVLIERMPGRGCVTPKDPVLAAVDLGAAVAQLHALPLPEGLPDLMERAAMRKSARDPVLAALLVAHAAEPQVFSHGDFWSGNALWEDDRLTAVIDWNGAGVAPRGYDVSWCRLDLVLLHDAEVADEFLAAYEEAAGLQIGNIAEWDLSAALRSENDVEAWTDLYHDLGRTDMTPGLLRQRHAAWLALLRREMSGAAG